MSEAQFQHAEDLREAFYALMAARILNLKDKEQPLINIFQKLSKSEEELEAQLGKLCEEESDSKSDVIPNNDNDSKKQQQLPSINPERKDGTRKSKNEESNCSVCLEKERKIRSNCPKCLESKSKNSKEEKSKTVRETEGDENEQRLQSSTKPFKLQVQDFKQKQPQGYWWSRS